MGSGPIAPSILNLGGKWSASCPGCSTPREESLLPLDRGLSGPRNLSGCSGEEKKATSLPLPRPEP